MTSADDPIEVDATPFDLPPSGPALPAAALCVHGLTGTPYEVRPLGRALADRGVRAYGPLLPGHGAGPRALARVGWHVWLDAVRQHYADLRDRYERVYVLGLSLGGVLCLALAEETEDLAGMVVVGTPLALRQPIPMLVPWLKWLVPMRPKREGSDIRDPAARARHPSEAMMPLASVHELMRLQRRVRGRLARVRAPILVAHGRLDTTANPSDAERIGREVGSEIKQILYCERSGHVVPVDYDGQQLASAAAEFLISRSSSRLPGGV